ncbi:hypothetical protein [Ramlibacter henchirensis]|uniref:hypothetical protein n=1 Tax=Ramlibacter henchirensis TaxID=204072 RepID=UPI001F0EBB90|nr:hypothetical protein [Ramlibacter henchirensis]
MVRLLHRFLLPAWLAAAPALAQAPAQPPPATLPGVTISSKGNPDPVEKSYRRMVRGIDLFERNRAKSPQGQLRFKLLPRKPGVSLDKLELLVLGKTIETPIPVAPDRTFVLARDQKAWDENAMVTPDRKALTMTWRAEVRTPGLPPDTRRLGDLRLECQVGMEAGLYSNSPSFITRIFSEISSSPAYCDNPENRYLFFAERPVFGVTLVSGARREMVPASRLYAAAIDTPTLAQELQFCDCEVLLDRTYFLPLGDRSWPDDTLVVFDYMEDGDARR